MNELRRSRPCQYILSEDSDDHAVYEGVTVVNPFAPGFDLAALLG